MTYLQHIRVAILAGIILGIRNALADNTELVTPGQMIPKVSQVCSLAKL